MLTNRLDNVSVQLPLRRTLDTGRQLAIDTLPAGGVEIELDGMRSQEVDEVRALLNRVVLEGNSYPHNRPLTESEFAAYWMAENAYVVRAKQEILGAFYIKSNFPGRSSHICNAGFIVQPACRGQGIGRWMAESMLVLAKQLGYKAVMFNLVFEINAPSISLWRTLGFSTIGRIPAAARMDDGRMVDALMFYRQL